MDPTLAFMAGAVFGGALVLGTIVAMLRLGGGEG